MTKRTKIILAVVAAVVLIGGVSFALMAEEEKVQEQATETDQTSQTEPSTTSSSNAASDSTSSQPTTNSAPDTPVSNEAAKAGRYTTYSKNELSAGYDTNVIFFYAPWCPECRAFKQAIQSGTIPPGVQFLEADFDSSTDLKKQYGVTLQSTFVKVSASGSQQSKWVGYGKEKSTQTVLNNL